MREKYGTDVTPAIVPPTYAKLKRKPWLEDTWKAALGALRSARVIVFMGYSLPSSDGFTTALLTGAMAFGAVEPEPSILVVDPSRQVHERFERLFGERKQGLEPMKLDEATRGHVQDAIRSVVRI